MWLHALTLAAPLAASIAVADPDRPPTVVAVPFGDDVPSETLSRAVENALPRAAGDRGLGAVRASSVQPVVEALARCRDDGCRVKNARRLGARFAVVGATRDGALLLRILDTEVGDVVGSARVDGDPPAVLAGTPAAVDRLVDQVAPKATHVRTAALARARRAAAGGDLDAADAGFAAAIAAAPPGDDKDVVNLWLERVRLFDAADREREGRTWDAFAAALGPGTPGYAALADVDQARVRTALHESLVARAAFDESSGEPARLAAAARVHLRLAALFPDERAQETLAAGRLLAKADDPGARAVLEKLVADETVDADTRLAAMTALHAE